MIPRSATRAGANAIRIEFLAGDEPLNRNDDIPSTWKAVANGAEVEASALGTRHAIRFSETEPLPTCLFAFAAGKFQVETAERSGCAFRLFHRETDAAKVARNRDAIFDLHARAGRSEIATSGATLTRRDPLGRGLIWPQRLDVTIGYPDRVERREVSMNGREATVPLGNGRPLYVVPNGVGIGYGLFRLDDATLQYLVRDFWMGVRPRRSKRCCARACRQRIRRVRNRRGSTPTARSS